MVKLASSFDVFTLKPGDIVSAKSLSTASSLSCTVVVVGSKIDIEFVTITLQIQCTESTQKSTNVNVRETQH